MTDDNTVLMVAVARHFFGEPNPALSNDDELIFGDGIQRVDLHAGIYFDEMSHQNGDAVDLIKRHEGFANTSEAYAWAEAHGYWANGHAKPPEPEQPESTPEYDGPEYDGPATKPKPPPLPLVNMLAWDDGPPPELSWAIDQLVPRQQVGTFFGPGGGGKTTIELTKDVAHVVGLPWLNFTPVQGPSLYAGCEDPELVWRIRLTQITKHYQITFAELSKSFHLINLFGQDTIMFYQNGKSGRIQTTQLYDQLYQMAGDLKPINISLDPLARVFSGNEMDRTQAYGTIARCQALALASGGSVTIVAHPSLRGITTGSGLSGSTGWHDASRFRQYLKNAKGDDDGDGDDQQEDNGLRELVFMKNQYGPPAHRVTLKYQRGLWLPLTAAKTADDYETAVANAKVDNAFLDSLDRFLKEGRNVSAAKNAPNYAPTAFAEAKCGFKRGQLIDAMERLFKGAKIRVEPYKVSGHERQRIARRQLGGNQ